jgi:hypothetical protein
MACGGAHGGGGEPPFDVVAGHLVDLADADNLRESPW